SHRRHRGALSAGRTRPVRLPHRLLLAGAGARSAEPRARLDVEVRRRAEGLAQDRSHLPVTTMKRLLLVLAAVAVIGADKPKVAAGTGPLIIGSYPKQFWIIDEATEKVVGTIPYTSGIPRRTTLSRDRKRFYTVEAQMEKVEVVDIAARKTIDTFTLSEGNKKVRIRSLEPDPLHRFVVMLTGSATKQVDRFEIGAPTLVQYDLSTHKVVRTI